MALYSNCAEEQIYDFPSKNLTPHQASQPIDPLQGCSLFHGIP